MGDPFTGAVVPALVKIVFDKVSSPAFEKIGRGFGVQSELERIRHTLPAINAVLLDAEEQQTTNHSVRNWLLDLKEVTYEIEDVLDLISTQALEDQFRQTTLVRLSRILFPQLGLASKLKTICERLDEVSANRRDFHFQEGQGSTVAPPDHINKERYKTPFIQKSRVFGRKKHRDWILSHLVSSSSRKISEIQVLPIVGIGGIGKTTLAKLLFCDPIVRDNFSLKLWASMPNEFSMETVIEKIFECATEENASAYIPQAILTKVLNILAGQTFLLVLDNVWASTPNILSSQSFLNQWKDLMDFLEVGSMNSRIIVTTREEKVVSIVGTMEACRLEPLSNDACWSIFAKYAFRDDEEREWPLLVEIGKEIVRTCRGVPLAARTLGSLLWNVRDERYWMLLKYNMFRDIRQAPDGILHALKLSFDQLPYYLKACFSFCSARAKNYKFAREEMVYYWMALGLIESTDRNETIEESGTRYFDELLSRSFFEMVNAPQYLQTAEDNFGHVFFEFLPLMNSSNFLEIRCRFQMHDLVDELRRYIGKEETAFVSFERHEVSTRVKHLVWTEEEGFEGEFPSQLLTAKKARSFQLCPKKGGLIRTSFLKSLISNFTSLRILSLTNSEFEELPNSIGDSKHLRFLNLYGNGNLKRLPDSISKLVNLQIMNVSGCTQLQIFPRKLHRWISLRHLYFTSKLDSCLETSYHGWTSIQTISISGCAHLTSLSDEIGSLITLRGLEIKYCPNLASLPNSIQLLTALEQLEIGNCEKLNLSGWEGLNGLRSLRVLIVDHLHLLDHFPDGLQHCTSLLKLIITGCGNLCTLPGGIEALIRLQVLFIIGNNPILRSRCEREIGYDWNLIAHIPVVHV